MSNASEADLLARCRRGDAEAWDALFDAHYPGLVRFIFQLGSQLTKEDAEEIAQEVFLSVVRHLETFRGACQFQTWLFHIAANKTRDFRERQDAAKRGGGARPLSLQAEDPETGLALDPASALPAPDAQLASVERLQFVRQALDEVGDPCRLILEMRYFADLSYDEIARALEMNPKTVSSRLSKCLDRLEALTRERFAREKSTPHSV